MRKYKVVNLTEEQYEMVEAIRQQLIHLKRGPYGGYGGSASMGKAVEVACRHTIGMLKQQVQEEMERKRFEASRFRRNNNPGLTPGISRKETNKPNGW